MKPYTHVIWDFNGTIYDDVDVCIRSANRLLGAHGMPSIGSVEEYRAQFGFPVIDYYKRIGFDFDKTPYADLAVEWVAYYLEESRSASLYPDVIETLNYIKERGIPQLILSATERTMLEGQVTELGIRDYFDTLLGLENIHARSKVEIGRAWADAHPEATLLYIGDTDHDALVARAMGADCILLTCGHQSRKTLEAAEPLLVADSLHEAICEKQVV